MPYNFSYLKDTVLWLLIYSELYMHHHHFRTSCHFSNKLFPWLSYPSPFLSRLETTTNLLPISVDFPVLDILYE